MKRIIILAISVALSFDGLGQNTEMILVDNPPTGPEFFSKKDKTTLSSYLESGLYFVSTNNLSLRLGRDYLIREREEEDPSLGAVKGFKSLFARGVRSSFLDWAQKETSATYWGEYAKESLRDTVIDFLRFKKNDRELSELLSPTLDWKDGIRKGIRPLSLNNPYVYLGYGWLDSDDTPVLDLNLNIKMYRWREPVFEMVAQLPLQNNTWQLGIGAEVRPFFQDSYGEKDRSNNYSLSYKKRFSVTFGLEGPFLGGRLYIRANPVLLGGIVVCSIAIF